MTTQLPAAVASYVETINNRDAARFLTLFHEDALVEDVGRKLRGRAALQSWSDSEIFGAKVTLELVNAESCRDEAILDCKVDGDFDRTGLPDPLIIRHRFVTAGDKITALTCQLLQPAA